MFFITNRHIIDSREGLDKVTKSVNNKGPNELSALRITGIRSPKVELLDDILSKTQVKTYDNRFKLGLDLSQTHYASLKVACEIYGEAQKTKKNVLLYVHGYNNDIGDVYETALEIQKLYGVIVVGFTWPANGGGAASGTLSYRSDKRDARASGDALNRTVEIIGEYYRRLVASRIADIRASVQKKHPENQTRQRELFAQLLAKECPMTLNMLIHSMGNYVLKHALRPEHSEARELVFDNIVLAAADTNNEGHEEWVEKLDSRRAIYILINENDYALSWSRRKPGEEQKARLGHYLKNLNARNATYVDVTRNKGVGRSHSYYRKDVVDENMTLKRFMKDIFNGKRSNQLRLIDDQPNLHSL